MSRKISTPSWNFWRQVKATYPEKSVWAFSGYLFDRDILPRKAGEPGHYEKYLGYLNVLVDGPFVEAKRTWLSGSGGLLTSGSSMCRKH